MVAALVRRESELGMVLESEFEAKFKYVKPVNVPKTLGISPVSLKREKEGGEEGGVSGVMSNELWRGKWSYRKHNLPCCCGCPYF